MSSRKGFRKDERGVVAIEFALLAVPYFLVIFAIMEVALVLTASMQFESATERVSRRIMTGELKPTKSTVRDAVCAELVFKVDCSALRIDYREIASVNEFDLPAPVKNRAVDESAFAFNRIATPSFASLRAGYEWPLAIKPMAHFLAGLDNDKVFLIGTALTRIEQ